MKSKIPTIFRWGAAALMVGTLAACGGGGGGGSTAAPPPGGTTPPAGAVPIADAAKDPANDTAINPTAALAAVQNSGVPAVIVNSPPVVNFTVFSDGAVVKGLELTPGDARFIIVQLARGTNGDPDQWKSYNNRIETPTSTVGPGGTPVLASAVQATTVTATADTLKYNDAGYYTFTFTDDIKDPTKTNGVVFDPALTHRVAIQLSYKNAAGETVLVNPYFDFTIDANGNAVAVTDSNNTRKMVDVSNCNECHNKLALHGGGRVDTQFCVTCHNSGTTDANSGNVLELKTMVHKLHAGRRLESKGVNYTIWGYRDSEHDYSEVGFPMDLRNCTKCHSASKLDSAGNPVSPQGDNWKKKPTKQACLTCHTSDATSTWYNVHVTTLNLGANADSIANATCATCHGEGQTWRPEQAHYIQAEASGAKYKMNIESATYTADTTGATKGKVTVKYFVTDPTNNDTTYNLTADCTGACTSSNKFGNVKFYLAYQTLIGQPTTVTEFSSYNNSASNGNNGNSGTNANFSAYAGTNDGSNHYTADLVIPADSATFKAAGTARVLSQGRVIEPRLDPISRNPVSPPETINVSFRGAFTDVAISGTLTPRRTVVSTEKCNACHNDLGTGSGSNTLANAFHRGDRDYVEACVLCHDPLRMSSTVMADGSAYQESYQFKRMIHGIHGGTKRTFPFTHGNKVVGAFNKDCTLIADPSITCTAGTENFAAEVVFPGIIQNCNNCHVNDSWKSDRGTLGSVVLKPTGVTDPLGWLIASPKAASCTACHDDVARQGHVISVGSGAWGIRQEFGVGGFTYPNATQAEVIAGTIKETCEGCHAPGSSNMPIDVAHGLK